jgi:hypothetical protein
MGSDSRNVDLFIRCHIVNLSFQSTYATRTAKFSSCVEEPDEVLNTVA